ncbi:hypothetical protein FRC11_000285, partial [Ceratobasidium sp. 423]
MSVSSHGTWIYVDYRRPDQQEPESYLKATAPRRPLGIPVIPEELDKQQELLNYYEKNNQKKRGQHNETKGSSGQRT